MTTKDARWEPGARWERYGKPTTVERESYFQGLPWVHFAGIHEAFEYLEINEANGWRFVGPAESDSEKGGER
jgi:hypothetical protein